jgi:hypothetical protein
MALSEKQFKVINDLFECGGDEAAVRQKNNISLRLWHKWLKDKNFTEGIASRLEYSKRSSQILLAKYKSLAAVKLVQLCDSNNSETSRKACMGILELEADIKQANEPAKETTEPAIDSSTASKLLAALAENNP